jgi:hypothetical protein
MPMRFATAIYGFLIDARYSSKSGGGSMMKRILMVAFGLTLAASPVFASHHCVDQNKKEVSVTGKTTKEKQASCKSAGGKWVSSSTKKTTTAAK